MEQERRSRTFGSRLGRTDADMTLRRRQFEAAKMPSAWVRNAQRLKLGAETLHGFVLSDGERLLECTKEHFLDRFISSLPELTPKRK